GRDILWRDAFNLWLKSPFFGVGFRLHERFLPFHSSTHNAYLAMLADMGIFGLLWYLALLVGAGLAAFSISDAKTRDLAIAMIVGYAVVGLFERRAVNAGNPVSILFMVTCFFSLTQRDLMRVRRRMAETRGTDPSLDGAEQA